MCTPQALRRDPELVHRFYDERRARLAEVAPNPAHLALARLEREWPGAFCLVTQNVDDLHERGGSRKLIHMHGELKSVLCVACGRRERHEGSLAPGAVCGDCSRAALRPDIVFFGEMPYRMDAIEDALAACDLFVSIGTSGAVYPAASFVRTAAYRGARTLELNLEPSEGSLFFDESRMGSASDLVPAWVEEVLAT